MSDDPMLDVEGSMDRIDPPPSESTISRKRPLILLKMLRNILYRGGHFVKVRSQIGTKGM